MWVKSSHPIIQLLGSQLGVSPAAHTSSPHSLTFTVNLPHIPFISPHLLTLFPLLISDNDPCWPSNTQTLTCVFCSFQASDWEQWIHTLQHSASCSLPPVLLNLTLVFNTESTRFSTEDSTAALVIVAVFCSYPTFILQAVLSGIFYRRNLL